jgi:hypothetical protein
VKTQRLSAVRSGTRQRADESAITAFTRCIPRVFVVGSMVDAAKAATPMHGSMTGIPLPAASVQATARDGLAVPGRGELQ